MKVIKLLGLFLLVALPLQAQYVQGGAVNAAPDTVYQYTGSWAASTSYTYTFAKPTVAPCTVILTIRQPGLLIPGFTSLAGTSYGEAWQKTTCGGDTSVTVDCPAGPCWAQFTVSEYAGLWQLDQASPEVVNAQSASGWTAPITPTQNGELVIGFGSNHTTDSPQITAGAGFTLRAVGNEFIEDVIQATAGPIDSTVTYSQSVEWCQTTLSFKPVGPATPPPVPPDPISITVDISALQWCTKCDGSDYTPMTGNLVIQQTGGPVSSFGINSDGSVQASGTVDLSQDPLEFTFSVTDANNVTLPGESFTWKLPKFAINLALQPYPVTVGIVRFTHITIPFGGEMGEGSTCQEQAGCPAVQYVSGSFGLGK